MKKILALISILAAIAFVLYTKEASPRHHVVGIVQIVEHPALDASRNGLIDKLKKLGFENGKNVQIVYESAQGNPALASQIAQKFVGQKVDVIVSLATTPSQAALQNIMQSKDSKKIPLVFLSVSDPLSAKLVEQTPDNRLVSKYACGISNYVPPIEQLEMFRSVLPSLKNLGFIYNPGEANSVNSLSNLEKLAPEFGLNIIAVAASKTSDVILAAHSLEGKVEAIFIDNDNTALAAFAALSDFCRKNKIALFSSDTDLIDQAIACLGPDQYRLGEQGAEFVAILLKGENTPEELGVQYPDKVELFLNNKIAKDICVEFSSSIQQKAFKTVD